MRIQLTAAGRDREYLAHVPDSLRARPTVVIVLHGAGATAEWMRDETGWHEVAERDRFLVVFPEGLTAHPEKSQKFLTNPQRWNDGSPTISDWADAPNDTAFLGRLLDDLEERFLVDRDRVFLTGFSNGAGMTFRAAAELFGRFAAIAPVAGHCWLSPMLRIPSVETLYLIGTVDPLIPLAGGVVTSPWRRTDEKPAVQQTLDRWAMIMGCGLPGEAPSMSEVGQCLEYFTPSGIRLRAEIIEGLGHHWPGGLGRMPTRFAGPTLDTVRGTERIWQFFQDVAARTR